MSFRLPALVALACALAPAAAAAQAPARLRVRGFTCSRSGTVERLTLRCKRGRRVATARWIG